MIEPTTVALRSTILIFVGIIGVGCVSGYNANPSRRGEVPLWTGIVAVALLLLICVGSTTLGAAIAAACPVSLGYIGTSVVGLVGFVSALWASSIVIQFVQNAFYRRVGAPEQPIRWLNVQRVSGRKRKAKPPAT